MITTLAIEQQKFQRILRRNVAFPLVLGVISAGVFVALIFYLLSVMGWVEHSERVIGDANEITKMASDKETGLRGFLITDDETFLAPYALALAKMPTAIAALSESVSDNPPQVERLARIRALQQQWDGFAASIIDLRRNGGDYRSVIMSGRGKVEMDGIRREFGDFLDVELRLRQERASVVRQVTAVTVGLFLLVSFIVSFVLAWSGRRELTRLSADYGAALLHERQHAEALEQQAWLRSGQTELSARTVGQLSIGPLGKEILSFLAEYLDVVVAVMYVSDDGGTLHRRATYAFDPENVRAGKTFAMADSLVSQAASEGRMIQLDDVPDGYLNVTSGLGDAPPRQLILMPLDNGGRVNGVLELGLMQPLAERGAQFLKLIAGNIGTSLDLAVTRQREQDLLAETQQLNEELQTQQEELRAANEELEAQSRTLEESQASLERQKSRLEQSNRQLSSQATQLDDKNSALNDAQAALEERAKELQRASQYKSEFLANMSHELRTPLNSSLILAKLLADNANGNLNTEQVRFAETIYSAGNDLLALINDILDISKVEAGQLELVPEVIPMFTLVDSLKRTFEPLAAEKRLALTVHIDETAPASVVSDHQRLEQILKNLLSNAIKFTEQGSVTLNVAAQDANYVRFVIRDSGIGIARDQQQRVFDAFQQADGTINRRYGGTGLGLSISRNLATLLHGEILVDSELGRGSTFVLVLPTIWTEDGASPVVPSAARDPIGATAGTPEIDLPITAVVPAAIPVAAPAAAPAAAPVRDSASAALSGSSRDGHADDAAEDALFPDDRRLDLSAGRVALVIEDDPGFAKVLYDLAHEMRFHCLVAHRAEDGLALAIQHAPVAILLDMRLPDRPGLSVLQRLKDDPRTRHIPVHVVSAADRSEAALHLGAIGYVIKPTTLEQLREVFRKLEARLTQKVKHVLLVEDDARQRDSVIRLIGDDDIEITAVGTGAEALTQLREALFDCMIIDLTLPDMQGRDLLEHMTKETLLSYPPAIVYTGRNLTRSEELDLLKYSRSIIIKGARSPERLLDEVTLFLHKVEAELSPERQAMLQTARNRDRLFEGRRILLVDDDVRNIFALTSALEHKGAIIDIARDGAEAIEKLEQIDDIDLVLMDVMMPGMDGLEATRRLRRDVRFEKIPIIAVTAKARKEDQEQCLQAGATDYMAKPIDLERLYALLRVWMSNIERL